jgi:DNA-binding GntR family transcriptional regulator
MRIVRSSLYVEAADLLRERIFNGELAPGSWIDELALCNQMGISRTPMREALKVLASEGLVQLEARRGCYVSEVSDQDIDDIFPVIALLEGCCAREAATRATAEDLAQLEVLHERLARYAKVRRINDYYQVNMQIHESIIRLAGNRWLGQVIGDLRKILKLSRQQQLRLPGRIESSCAEHMAVFAALKARDPDGADAAMRTHLLRQRDALNEWRALQAHKTA